MKPLVATRPMGAIRPQEQGTHLRSALPNDAYRGSDTTKLAIYGAEPTSRGSRNPIESIVRSVKYARAFRLDAKGWRQGDLSGLDYRNYVSPYSTNQGDLAICQAVERFARIYEPDAVIERIRWGAIHPLQPVWSNFIVAGSGYVILDAQGKVSPRLASDIQFFRRHDIKPVIFGVGINQPGARASEGGQINIDPETAASMSELLSLAKGISVRDAFTRETFARYTDKTVELIGDPALHLGQLCGIAHQAQHAGKRRLLIGLNLNFHGPTSTRLLQRNLPIIVAALRSLRDRYDCDFRYFVHFEASSVIPRLLALEGIKMHVVQGSPETLLRHYADLDLHIGGMLHSCILAHSVGTPAIALAYDIKHRGFMELFGLEGNCISASGLTSSELLDRVDGALASLSSHRATIEQTRKRLEGDTHRFARKYLGT